MKNTVEFTVDSTPSPTTPIGTINTGPHMPETEPFSTLAVLVVALILLAVVIALALFYKRNRKSNEAKP